MPGGAGRILGGLLVGVDFQRIAFLVGLVVVIVVVVKEQDFRLQAGLPEGGSHNLQEIALVLPRHIQGHRVTAVQRLVLKRNVLDHIPPFLHLLDPLHEIVCIVGVVFRVQAAGSPACDRGTIRDLHPNRAAPRGADDLHIGIDLVDFIENREEKLFFAIMDSKVRHSFFIAPGILVHREIRAAYAYANQRRACTFGGAEQFSQKPRTVFLTHFQKVKAGSLCNGKAKAIHRLESLIRKTDGIRRLR